MLEYITTTATTPVLMWLYRLAGAGSFCFNSILPFFWLYMHPHDLTLKPYHSKYFCTHSSQDFLGWPFFLFPVISTSITSHTWELQMALNYYILNLFSQQHPITKNISRYPINQSHPRTSSWSYDVPPHATLSHQQQ